MNGGLKIDTLKGLFAKKFKNREKSTSLLRSDRLMKSLYPVAKIETKYGKNQEAKRAAAVRTMVEMGMAK